MKYTILVLLSVLILSCEKDSLPISRVIKASSLSELFGHKEELGAYAVFGASSNSLMKISIQDFPSNDLFMMDSKFGRYTVFFKDTIRDPGSVDVGIFKIGDLEFQFNDRIKSYQIFDQGFLTVGSSGLANKFSTYYGREVEYSLTDHMGGDIMRESIYIPDEIKVELSSSEGFEGGSVYHRIRRADCQVSWNLDQENENGVFVWVTWSGELIDDDFGSWSSGPYVYRAQIISEELGTQKLSEEIFSDIPLGAVVSLDFYRGELIIVKDQSNHTYKLEALSMAKKKIMLID